MKSNSTQTQHGWYRYGVAFIALEACIAILQTAYAIYMVLTGAGGLGGGH